jgi:hypothetical protein
MATGAPSGCAARVGGELDMRRVELRNDAGPAVDATNLVVESNMFLDHAKVTGHGDRGALRLSGVRVDGLLVLDGADIANTSGPGLSAEGAHVGGELLVHGARVSGAGSSGAICLPSARVGHDLYVVDAEVRKR